MATWFGGEFEEQRQQVRRNWEGFAGREMTPEEQAKVEAELNAARSRGELLYLTLSDYDPQRGCQKCLWEKTVLVYTPENVGVVCLGHAGFHEHFHRQCERCGFVWVEKVPEGR